MALLKTFAVFDSAVGAYLQPFNLRTHEEGIRLFKQNVNNEQTAFAKFPGDYTLFCIGTYDEESGKYRQDGAHQSLGNALELLDKTANPDQLNLVSPG